MLKFIKKKNTVKYIFAFFLAIATIFASIPACVSVYGAASADLPDFPELVSQYVVLMDADSGEVLYSSNANEKCYPASTTKLMTALVTMENLSFNDTITYSERAVNSITYGDANASISVGEELTMEQSLYCLILRSANDVAYGLAENVAGSVSEFADMMNKKAEALGCSGTHFTNASGLSDTFHYTTPYDMALIARACFDNKSLMKIISYSDMYIIGPTNTSSFTRYYTHRYQMLENGEYAYPYSMGGKTGYTDAAGSCLVSFAQKDDLRLICVIMNSTDEGRYTDTAALFDYYFDNYKKLFLSEINSSLPENDTELLTLTDELDSSNTLNLKINSEKYLLVPNKVKADELSTLVTYSNDPAYAGDEGGFACISYYYKTAYMGKSTVYMESSSDTDSLPGIDGVPAASMPHTEEKEELIYINIWYVLIGTGVLLALIILILILVKVHRPSPGYNTKKLRF